MDHELFEKIDLPIELSVLSATPERLRVRLGEKWREPEIMEQIVQTLQQFVPQIQQAKTTPQTGSLTLYLEPGAGAWEDKFGMLETLGIIAIAQGSAAASTTLPQASQRLNHLFSGWNQQVNQWTKGAADLRFLLPMTFAILAFRRLVTNGNGLKSAPWYILAWYAFDSFMKLNPPPVNESATQSTPPSAAQKIDPPKIDPPVAMPPAAAPPASTSTNNRRRSPKSYIPKGTDSH